MALDWSTIKGVTISEGAVTKIEDSEGRVIWKKGKKLKKLAVSSESAWVITEEDELYGCGYNAYGQQGSGDTAGVNTFTKRMDGVGDVVCSDFTTWAKKNTTGSDYNMWYGCGRNQAGQQGSGNTTDVLTFTARMKGTKLLCSSSTTFIKDPNGDLYGCGYNEYGQQGSGGTANVLTFTKRATGIIDFACSAFTTWYLKSLGSFNQVYGCGRNDYGQQGSGDTTNVTSFTQRTSGSGTTMPMSIGCGNYTSWYSRADGAVYGCGRSNYGQCATTSTTNKSFKQKSNISAGGAIIKYICTDEQTWILSKMGSSSAGVLYGCGRNQNGQIGVGTESEKVTSFTSYSGVMDAVASINTTWIIKSDGTLWGCGSGASGQQGSGGTANVLEFTQRLTGVTQADCSHMDTYAITDEGIMSCGYNQYRQHGYSGSTNVFTPADIQ